MSGVRGFRIVHESARWPMVVTVADLSRPLSPVRSCPSCQTAHLFKTYHISVNDQGAAIVSPGVLEGLRRAGMGGFAVESGVVDPPTKVLGGSNGKLVEIPRRDRIVAWHT